MVNQTSNRSSRKRIRPSNVRAKRSQTVDQLGDSATHVVRQAATLLDEELAAGIVAARQVQRRFRDERRIDPGDFRGSLEKFQSDGHDLISMVGDQVQKPRSKETDELIQRFVGHAQSMLDMMVEMVNTGAELANQVATPVRKSKRKRSAGSTRRAKR